MIRRAQHGDIFFQGAENDLYPVYIAGGSDDKESARNAGDPDQIPGSGDPPEKEMATHSSILVQRIPWTEESKGSQRVEHD